MICKNCDAVLNENFCPNCGQSNKVAKITLLIFLAELSDNVFQINKGLFYTIKELFVRPGQTIRNFLVGKRKNYFKPIAYVFTLSTLYFLLAQLFDGTTLIDDTVSGYTAAANDFEKGSSTEKVDRNIVPILNWLSDNYAITTLLLIPIFSLASYLSFFKTGWNYLEHFVLNAYITGQQALIYAFFTSFNLVLENRDLLVNITLFSSIFYNFIVFWQFFNQLNRKSVILRSIATYLLFSLLFLVITGGLFLITSLYFKFTQT